jgi:hypothetical protein
MGRAGLSPTPSRRSPKVDSISPSRQESSSQVGRLYDNYVETTGQALEKLLANLDDCPLTGSKDDFQQVHRILQILSSERSQRLVPSVHIVQMAGCASIDQFRSLVWRLASWLRSYLAAELGRLELIFQVPPPPVREVRPDAKRQAVDPQRCTVRAGSPWGLSVAPLGHPTSLLVDIRSQTGDQLKGTTTSPSVVIQTRSAEPKEDGHTAPTLCWRTDASVIVTLAEGGSWLIEYTCAVAGENFVYVQVPDKTGALQNCAGSPIKVLAMSPLGTTMQFRNACDGKPLGFVNFILKPLGFLVDGTPFVSGTSNSRGMVKDLCPRDLEMPSGQLRECRWQCVCSGHLPALPAAQPRSVHV